MTPEHRARMPRMTAELLTRAVELQRMGWTHEQISKEIGLSRPTVTKRLGQFNAQVFRRLSRRATAQLGAQLTRLDWLAREATEAWLKSKGNAVTVKEFRDVAGSEVPTKVEKTTKGQDGNPAFLREIRETLAEIRTVLGIDKGQNVPPNDDFILDLSEGTIVYPLPPPPPG